MKQIFFTILLIVSFVNFAIAKESVLTVEKASPIVKNKPNKILVFGQIESDNIVQVSLRVANLPIKKIQHKTGDRVKKGELLLELDDESLQIDLTKKEAEIRMKQVSLDKAKDAYTRSRSGNNKGVVSDQDAKKHYFEFKSAEADLLALQASLKSIQLDLKNTKVLAPVAGTLLSKDVKEGQISNSGLLAFQIQENSNLKYCGEFDSVYSNSVEPGMNVIITQKNSDFEGSIREINPEIDSKSNRVKFCSDIKSQGLMSGMYLGGHIETGTSDVILVKSTAIITSDGRYYIFVINTDNSVNKKEVRIGEIFNGYIEVVEGLTVEDAYVVTGGVFLNDGDVVRVQEGVSNELF